MNKKNTSVNCIHIEYILKQKEIKEKTKQNRLNSFKILNKKSYTNSTMKQENIRQLYTKFERSTVFPTWKLRKKKQLQWT